MSPARMPMQTPMATSVPSGAARLSSSSISSFCMQFHLLSRTWLVVAEGLCRRCRSGDGDNAVDDERRGCADDRADDEPFDEVRHAVGGREVLELLDLHEVHAVHL